MYERHLVSEIKIFSLKPSSRYPFVGSEQCKGEVVL